MATLNHPYIVSVYDVGDGYIVNELVDGEPLRGDPANLTATLHLAMKIAEGLPSAHLAGIVHRDLKPANVLVTREGNPKILDFGLAKLLAQLAMGADRDTASRTDSGMTMGTAGYMSPEQVRGANSDHRSDIFSFGAILHEMITGERAFHGDTSVDIMHAILHDPPSALPETTPTALSQIVAHCLEKDPANRFQSAQDLRFALSVITVRENRAPAAMLPERQSNWRRRALVWLMLVALGVGCGYLLWRPEGRTSGTGALTELDLNLGEDVTQFAVSNDGSQIVFVKGNRLMLQRLDHPGSVALAGAEDALYPFFSPDGNG